MLRRFLHSPQQKADEILKKIPGNSTMRNTTTLTLLASASAFALSKELYIFGEDTVLLASFATFLGLAYKQMKPQYLEDANKYKDNMLSIFTKARDSHAKVVATQIEEQSKLQDIEKETKSLFDMSRDIVALQKEAYELEQQVALTQLVKHKLDAWQRFEQGLQEQERQRMLQNVMTRIDDELKKKDVQQALFQQALKDLDTVRQ